MCRRIKKHLKKLLKTSKIKMIDLLKPFINSLGIWEIVDRIVPMERNVGGLSHGQVIEQLVLNRLDDPLPLLYLEDWAEIRSIRELYGISPDKLNDDRVGRALDAVAPCIDDIEEAIVLAVLSHFKIDPDQILWDTTSFYFEGDYDKSDLIRLGYSRDQKKDKKQAVVELNVTAREGIPLAHRLLPGNASDHKEALQNIKTLQKRIKKKDFLLIGDRAMLTKPNLAALVGKEVKFLGPLAGKDKEFILGFPEEQFRPLAYTTARGKGGYTAVDTSYTFNHNGGYYTCRAVVVKSEELYEQQRKTLDKNLRKIESGLEKIRDHLNVRKYKNPAYVAEQVKKVLDSHCVGKLFHVVLDGEEGALTLRWDYEPDLMEQQQRLLGKYVLVTSLYRETHDANQVLEFYKSRHRVEDRIRAMKSTLKIRPVFLQSEERIRSLVLVNIIALIVFSLIEWVCRQEGLAKSGKQALFMFRMPAIVTLTVNGHVIQQIGNIKPFMHDILAALKVKPLELDDMDTG
ncbi:MAG TPA: IS1634 family transposase [Syntrophomonadaceae bacterium]|nr:IS1634 family transposase [Syntrophomonadaceae bacterium]